MSKISPIFCRKGVVGPRFLVTASLIVVVLASGLAFLQQSNQPQASSTGPENTSSGVESTASENTATPSDTATETPASSPSPTPTQSGSGGTDGPSENPSSGSTGAGPGGQIPTGNTTSSSAGGSSATGSSGQGSTQTNRVGGTTQKPPSGIASSTSTTLNNSNKTDKISPVSASGKIPTLGQTTSTPIINIEPGELKRLSPETRTALYAALQLTESRPTLSVVVAKLIEYMLTGLLTPAAFNKFIAVAAGVPALPDLTSWSGLSNLVARFGRVF